jgi:hypothetical protein
VHSVISMSAGECIQSLKVDIDLPYSFVKRYFDHYVRVARYVLAMFRYRDVVIKLRRSPSGNAHVVVTIDRCIDPKDYHVVMWLLGDDHRRIQHSIRRHLATGHILDFHYTYRASRKVKKVCEQNPGLEVCRELEREPER